ncbi:hypothetical protein BDZ89DRAFT_650312 [Hymenopellis radicata]|nr:hypothetical protein BDZ89DRAFT_650312 [Hymenopellis radicata]
MVSPNPAAQGDFAFQRALSDSEFFASGHLHVTHHKAAKNSKDSTYIFYVVEGSVTVRIHQTHHTVHAGDMFLVPRGNLYSIENLATTTSRLIFCQAREVTSHSDLDPLRLIKLPKGMTTSKAYILLGWLVERLLKRFASYRKLGVLWSRRARFMFHQHVHGSRAYLLFFVLGFLARSVPLL